MVKSGGMMVVGVRNYLLYCFREILLCHRHLIVLARSIVFVRSGTYGLLIFKSIYLFLFSLVKNTTLLVCELDWFLNE